MAGNGGIGHSLPVRYIRIDHNANAWTFDKDSVQFKTRKTLAFQANFIDHFLRMIENIQNNKLHSDEIWKYISSNRIVTVLSSISKEMDVGFYEHHGRVIEKHPLIEEQDDTIRILRRKIVHRRNNMAEEKRLIKELKFADEARADTISANGVEKTWHFPQDRKKRVKDFKTKLLQQRKVIKQMKAEFDEFDKDIIESCEKQLLKMNEMKKEIEKLVCFLSMVVCRNA